MEVSETKSELFIVQELCTGGDLFDMINMRGPLSEHDSRAMFLELASAVAYCHELKISHRDLKAENILFDSRGNLKLADFGLCQIMKDGSALKTRCGSPDYVAPEIILNLPYDGAKVDAWSCGVLLYIMLFG